MKEIIAVSGSMRKGNTETLVETFLNGCKKVKGIKSTHVKLRELKPLQECGEDECWHKEKCSVKDSLNPLLEKIKKTDALILASPNYFNCVSGIFKTFIDRTNPYSKFRRFEGKKTCLIIAGGYSQEANEKALNYLREFARIHRLKILEEIKVHAEKKDDAEKNKKLLKEIELKGKKFGEKIE